MNLCHLCLSRASRYFMVLNETALCRLISQLNAKVSLHKQQNGMSSNTHHHEYRISFWDCRGTHVFHTWEIIRTGGSVVFIRRLLKKLIRLLRKLLILAWFLRVSGCVRKQVEMHFTKKYTWKSNDEILLNINSWQFGTEEMV